MKIYKELHLKHRFKKELSSKEVREKLLDVVLFVNMLTLPMILLGTVEAIELQLKWTAVFLVLFYFPLLAAFLFRKSLPYHISVLLLLFSGFSIGVVNIVVYGFSGAGIPIFCVISVLATLFYNPKIGFITILICSIPMTIVAILMSNHFITPCVDLMVISTLPISWLTAVVVMMFLAGIMIYGFGVIQKNLVQTLDLSKNQMRALQQSNDKYDAINEKLRQSNGELLMSEKKAIQSETNLIVKNHEYEKLNTKLQQTNERLLRAKEKAEESDRLKTEFINNISHEIRTPMNGILGFSKLLAKHKKTEEKRQLYVDIIQRSGTQLLRIIDDILEISELGTKQVSTYETKVCLNNMLSDLFFIFDINAKEKEILFYLKKGLSDAASSILTDEIKLRKIVSNLLENAFKFTNEGVVELGYHKKNNDLEIYVRDTGVGIKQEKQKSIFERFSQEEKELSKKFGGLGLGLSIAKENAKLLGGNITVESVKGKGATFFITIPYKPVGNNLEKKQTDIIGDVRIDEYEEYTILVAEDEELNYLYIKTLLEDEISINCTVIHAKNGKEAVEICKNNTAISLVLMDMKMPILNGFEATTQIKEFRPNLPIIAQTAYTSTSDKENTFSAGCDNYISKPITLDSLYNIIKKYLI